MSEVLKALKKKRAESAARRKAQADYLKKCDKLFSSYYGGEEPPRPVVVINVFNTIKR